MKVVTPSQKEQRHECTHCRKTFQKHVKLKRQTVTHSGTKPFMCKQSGKSFKRLDRIQLHTKKILKNILTQPVSSHLKKECVIPLEEWCHPTWKVSASSHLKRHTMIHKWEVFEMSSMSEAFVVSWVCELRFTIRATQRRNPLIVLSVARGSTYYVTWKSYLQSYTRLKPYNLAYCEKVFKTYYEPQIHERRHTEEKTTRMCLVWKEFYNNNNNNPVYCWH